MTGRTEHVVNATAIGRESPGRNQAAYLRENTFLEMLGLTIVRRKTASKDTPKGNRSHSQHAGTVISFSRKKLINGAGTRFSATLASALGGLIRRHQRVKAIAGIKIELKYWQRSRRNSGMFTTCKNSFRE